MAFLAEIASESSMIAIPSDDPVHALVPHTLKEPLVGAKSGALAGLTFMVKDLFAIKGRKVGNGNPSFYEHATPARETAPVIERLLAAGASCTGITICDEFFYSVLGSNAHYGQPVNSRASQHVTGGSSCGSAAAVAAAKASVMIWSSAHPVGAGIVSQSVASAVIPTCPYDASWYQASSVLSSWWIADAFVTESGEVHVTRIASTERVPEILVGPGSRGAPIGTIRVDRIRDPSTVPVTSMRVPDARDGNAPPRCSRYRSPPVIR